METINENAAVLCNYEVLELLKEIRNEKLHAANQRQSSILIETIQYLQESPCNDQTPEKIKNLLEAYEPFNLTKAEKLMLINNPPQKELDIHLMVEESADRLTDDQMTEIINISNGNTSESAE